MNMRVTVKPRGTIRVARCTSCDLHAGFSSATDARQHCRTTGHEVEFTVTETMTYVRELTP